MQRQYMKPGAPLMTLHRNRSTILLNRKVVPNRPRAVTDKRLRLGKAPAWNEVMKEIIERTLEADNRSLENESFFTAGQEI